MTTEQIIEEREDSIKMKMRFKRFLSGFMAVATLASVIIQPVAVSASELEPEEIIIRLSEIQELEEALGYLTKEDAELITLLFFEEFTVKETAQYFGCCPKTIRNRRKKVLEKLKEQLENT